VIVAVLDTGVDVNHPQLLGAIAPGGRDLVDDDGDPGESPDGIDNDGDGVVDEALGHGTFVAGLIRSVAPDARILPIRVLDSEGLGTAIDIAKGIEIARQNLDSEGLGTAIDIAKGIEIARQNGARVINLSLGMAVEADVVEELIDDLADEHGLIIVASAGNQSTSERQFPAGENDVISVAATDDTDRKADFSNFGSWVDVSAPGVGLVSLFPGNSLALWSGTSFAAALASGEAALLVSLRPTAGIDDIHDAIERSAIPVEDERLNNSGRIDVRAAVDWLLERLGDGE
jgi:subtilisin family serine protease